MFKIFFKVTGYLLLLTVILIVSLPIIYILLASFKNTQEFLRGGLNIIPRKINLKNYVDAWEKANFSRYTINSVIYCAGTSSIAMLFSSIVGFCFNRKQFPGKKLILGSYLGSMFIAGAVTVYPIFLIVVNLGLHKTIFGLIFASLGGSQTLGAFLVMGYLNSVPKELDEAAIIDGCGVFRVFAKVILPLIKPVLVIIAMLNFQFSWNNYMLPLALTIFNDKIRPLTVGIVALANNSNSKGITQWGIILAGSCMAILPVLIIFIAANKYFVSGASAGALKA